MNKKTIAGKSDKAKSEVQSMARKSLKSHKQERAKSTFESVVISSQSLYEQVKDMSIQQAAKYLEVSPDLIRYICMIILLTSGKSDINSKIFREK